MTLTKLNAVVFLTLGCATGATATNYYWNPSAATGRLTLLETWGTMSGGTWTAATALPTTSDTLILNGGSATLETAEAEYGTDGKVEFPAFMILNGGILEMVFPAGVQYVHGGGGMYVDKDSTLRVRSGTFFTNGKAMQLKSNAKAVFSGPDAILTTKVQGGHINNNVQFWDTNPTIEFENGAVASNAYFIAWGAGSCVRLTGAGTRLVAASVIDFAVNKTATGSRIEVTDGARVEASSMSIGADESSILLRDITYTSANGAVTLNGLRLSGECLSSTLDTTINFGGTDSRLFVSNCTATAEKTWRLGEGGGVGSEVTVTGGSDLSTGELVVGAQRSTNMTLRVTGAGTRMSVRCSNPHENSATIHMGYSASGGVNTKAEITDVGVGAQIVVDDGAYLELVPTAGTQGSAIGLVIGNATNGDRCRFTVGPGGEVYSRYGTRIGGTHSTWGGGSLGELLVSNGVYRSDASVTINGGTAGNPLRASTNNVLSVVAGGEATFAGTLLFNSTSETGNGLVRVDNGSLTVLNVRATTSGKYGPSTVEIGGTNGTLTASHLVDVSSPLNLRFKIGEAGRSTAEPMIHLTSTGYYHLPNTKEGLDNFTLRFDIDRKWAESGRRNYVDLLTMDKVTGNSTVDATNKSQLKALKDKIVAGDLINDCRLAVTADGRTLRLFAGPRVGTMLLIR